jgi:hypothetical protein
MAALAVYAAGFIEFPPRPGTLTVQVLDPVLLLSDIWLIDLSRSISQKFTFDAADEVSPVWSADSNRVFFASIRAFFDASNRQNSSDISSLYQKPVTGDRDELILEASDGMPLPVSASPDGRQLVYEKVAGGGGPPLSQHSTSCRLAVTSGRFRHCRKDSQRAAVRFLPMADG